MGVGPGRPYRLETPFLVRKRPDVRRDREGGNTKKQKHYSTTTGCIKSSSEGMYLPKKL